MIRNILEKIEGQTVTISQWMTGFAGIFFIRFILEALSSPTRSGIIASDPYTVIHYALFWTTLVLGIILIVGFFTRDYVRAAKAALFGLPAIWSAPIIDIVISHGKGLTQSYLFDNGAKLIADFFTFFGRTASWGATYGVRAEMALVLVGIGWYVWQKNKSVARTIAGIICSYVFGFIIFSWPGILYTLTHIHGVTASLTDNSSIFI